MKITKVEEFEVTFLACDNCGKELPNSKNGILNASLFCCVCKKDLCESCRVIMHRADIVGKAGTVWMDFMRHPFVCFCPACDKNKFCFLSDLDTMITNHRNREDALSKEQQRLANEWNKKYHALMETWKKQP